MNPHNQAVSRLQKVLSYSASLVSQLVEAVQSLVGRSARTHAHTHTHRVAESLNTTVKHFKSLTCSSSACTRVCVGGQKQG